ncbi:MAG: cobalamin biosynthesis protein CobW [Bauldia sp.]|uniref:cobalamin biosynthesis protein CobW n=1 Tax=Bauldia sp. TaxID=2575872 RepID=UPI001DA9218C|nr:cobalamin biosynthesis protein CobW [Bauldia sp.]MCB1497878.1 cobalamin biosynthesis protein CobW [Bauldia sp.]
MTRSRIPATVVTGFLGAGKTTLIRNLIATARGRRIAVVVNEFGDMGFDGALMDDCGDTGCRPDSIVELTNGCICCTVADEFLPTMEALLAREPAPDHIIIETSGLALPQPLVRAFAWPTVKHRVTVDGVVAVVDATAVEEGRFAPAMPTAPDPVRDHDDPIEELFEDQLRCADLVVVGKADLLGADAVDRVEATVLGEARPGTPVVRGSLKGLPADVLLGLAAGAEDNMGGRESHHELEGEEEHDHDDFASFVVDTPPFGTVEALKERVGAALAYPGVLRIKGRARVDGKAAPVVVQGVGPRVETYFDPAGGGDGLVVIGLAGLDPAAVSSRLIG